MFSFIAIYENLHKHTAARSRTASSGGSQSGKKGFEAYWANVRATIAWVVGRKISSVTHKSRNAERGPKASKI